MVLFLTIAFGLLWYLAGAGADDSPILGVASTMLVVGYVVVLGSFAALILTLLHGWQRLLALIPTLYLASFVWENKLVEQVAAATRLIRTTSS